MSFEKIFKFTHLEVELEPFIPRIQDPTDLPGLTGQIKFFIAKDESFLSVDRFQKNLMDAILSIHPEFFFYSADKFKLYTTFKNGLICSWFKVNHCFPISYSEFNGQYHFFVEFYKY